MVLSVQPSRVAGHICVPGSKSHTIRAITGALLAEGVSTLRAPLVSDDTQSALNAATLLGAKAVVTPEAWRITGTGGKLVTQAQTLDLGNSGTGLRMLTAVAALLDAPVTLDGDASLRSREMAPLLDALQRLGCKVKSAPGGHAPLTVTGPLHSGQTAVKALCSQFLTALLFVAPRVPGGVEICVTELAEAPYVEITLAWLARLGVKLDAAPDRKRFFVPGQQTLHAFDAVIPADFSTAAFPLAAGILAGGAAGVTIHNLDFSDAQGDKAIFAMLESLGAKLRYNADSSVSVFRSELRSGSLDLGATPDALPVLAALAAAQPAGFTLDLVNAAQARHKETDRIAAMSAELRKMGANLEEREDGMKICGGTLHGAQVNAHSDHRIAMALAVAALAAKGETQIAEAESCAVTYPDFIKDFQALGADFTT